MKFQLPTKIYFGPGAIVQLKDIIEKELKAANLFCVTDKGILECGIVDKVTSQFPDIPVFDEIEQNPKHMTVNKGGKLLRRLKPDLIIGLGGGSSIDAAKALALLATNPGNIEDYEGRHLRVWTL